MARRAARTTIGAALREKFKSPREALRALGLDESLISDPGLAYDGAKKMKATRLQYLLTTRAARIFNPQLAVDAKVNYGPLFKGVTTKNLKARRPTIISDAKKLLKGKTLAKDAGIEGLAHLLNKLEHPPNQANLDESVSGEQHRAMEAAAHGHSNLDIPKNVGKEFEHADKGKSFADKLPEFLRSKGVGEDIIKDAMSLNEAPENALDEDGEENVEIEVEEGEDGEIEEEEAEDKIEEEEGEDHVTDRKGKDELVDFDHKRAKDSKHAKDRKGAMDKKFVTVDAMNKGIEAAVKKERQNAAETMDARAFVRPYVGELPMALDSSEKVLRSAAEIMGIDEAADIHASALRKIIEVCGKKGSQVDDRSMAMDDRGNGAAKSFADRFPNASRIGTA